MKQTLTTIILFILIAGLFPVQIHAYNKYSQYVVLYTTSPECGPKVEKATDANQDYYLNVSDCDPNFQNYTPIPQGGFTFWKIDYEFKSADNWAFGYAWDGNFMGAIIMSSLFNPVCYCTCGLLTLLTLLVIQRSKTKTRKKKNIH